MSSEQRNAPEAHHDESHGELHMQIAHGGVQLTFNASCGVGPKPKKQPPGLGGDRM